MKKNSQADDRRHILVCDDEPGIRDLLSQYLGFEGYRVTTAPNAETARENLEKQGFDLLITDLRMPGMGGLGLLAWLQNEGPSIPAIVISAYGDVKDAVEAMRLGASDYVVKPFEPDELIVRIQRALKAHRMEAAVLRNREIPRQDRPAMLASENPAVRAVLSVAAKAAPSNVSVLITGESGTGKEVLARWIHDRSLRADGPFVPINLGGIPETLIESELFGYEKGAFTGADRRKIGLFELATGGSLFLDEIGDMPLPTQVKLLRVLQDRRIQRLGSTASLPMDVRILAATNKDLVDGVKRGWFREDLLYRINVIPLHLPPLRERTEDIPAMISTFLRQRMRPDQATEVSPDALAALRTYRFPGNVRELENMLERALILCEGPVLRPRDFSLGEAAAESVSDSGFPGPGRTIAEIERWAILRELSFHGGKRSETADVLGISRRTLLNKLKEYGID